MPVRYLLSVPGGSPDISGRPPTSVPPLVPSRESAAEPAVQRGDSRGRARDTAGNSSNSSSLSRLPSPLNTDLEDDPQGVTSNSNTNNDSSAHAAQRPRRGSTGPRNSDSQSSSRGASFGHRHDPYHSCSQDGSCANTPLLHPQGRKDTQLPGVEVIELMGTTPPSGTAAPPMRASRSHGPMDAASQHRSASQTDSFFSAVSFTSPPAQGSLSSSSYRVGMSSPLLADINAPYTHSGTTPSLPNRDDTASTTSPQLRALHSARGGSSLSWNSSSVTTGSASNASQRQRRRLRHNPYGAATASPASVGLLSSEDVSGSCTQFPASTGQASLQVRAVVRRGGRGRHDGSSSPYCSLSPPRQRTPAAESLTIGTPAGLVPRRGSPSPCAFGASLTSDVEDPQTNKSLQSVQTCRDGEGLLSASSVEAAQDAVDADGARLAGAGSGAPTAATAGGKQVQPAGTTVTAAVTTTAAAALASEGAAGSVEPSLAQSLTIVPCDGAQDAAEGDGADNEDDEDGALDDADGAATVPAAAAGDGKKKKKKRSKKARKLRLMPDLEPCAELAYLPPPPPPLSLTRIPGRAYPERPTGASDDAAAAGTARAAHTPGKPQGHGLYIPFDVYCQLLDRWYTRVTAAEADFVRADHELTDGAPAAPNTKRGRRGGEVPVSCPRRDAYLGGGVGSGCSESNRSRTTVLVSGTPSSANPLKETNPLTEEADVREESAVAVHEAARADTGDVAALTNNALRAEAVAQWATDLSHWWHIFVSPHTSRPRQQLQRQTMSIVLPAEDYGGTRDAGTLWSGHASSAMAVAPSGMLSSPVLSQASMMSSFSIFAAGHGNHGQHNQAGMRSGSATNSAAGVFRQTFQPMYSHDVRRAPAASSMGSLMVSPASQSIASLSLSNDPAAMASVAPSVTAAPHSGGGGGSVGHGPYAVNRNDGFAACAARVEYGGVAYPQAAPPGMAGYGGMARQPVAYVTGGPQPYNQRNGPNYAPQQPVPVVFTVAAPPGPRYGEDYASTAKHVLHQNSWRS